MNWILDHLQLIVIVASAFAWWLTQRRKDSQDEGPPPSAGRRPEADFDDTERTRRIQEEIRRKIAERRGAGGAPAQPPPVPVRIPVERPVEAPSLPPRRRMEPEWSEADAAAMDRQRRLQEQMRAAQERRKAAQAQVQDAFAYPASAPPPRHERPVPGATGRRRGSAWLQDSLRDPASIRRAIVLREVLGPPVGLR